MEMHEIPTPSRVARRVLIWIEPFLYRAILIDGTAHHTFDRRLIGAMYSKPPEIFHAIRHLAWWYTPETCSVAELKQLLRFFKEVIDLSCLNLLDSTLLPEMRLQRLTMSLEDIFGDSPDLAHPLFESITHLDLSIHWH
ncbi:hypothetical protein MSAN_00780700 [Mycena sanguinolenta]|uniref:Uncharacterized protein n=1 Tax=Mycena sanguinolenta TaxID=230812 RepID=A0A8H6Z645_9AGAR|nr:hypothetical protein MSAN_00780700 [Mycena sanguinolenta]